MSKTDAITVAQFIEMIDNNTISDNITLDFFLCFLEKCDEKNIKDMLKVLRGMLSKRINESFSEMERSH